jgi:hypothetical protein
MPKRATPTIPAKAWTRVTDATVTALRLQPMGSDPVLVLTTADTTAPVSDAGAVLLGTGKAILSDRLLATLFPDLVAACHVWVWCSAETKVSVVHA